MYRAKRLADGAKVAVKVLPREDAPVEAIEREFAIMRKLGAHANIMQLHEVFWEPTRVRLVLELCAGGDLHDTLQSNGPIAEGESAALMKQLLTAVAHMHEVGVIHRDLKLENVLLEHRDYRTAALKVADFGFAKDTDELVAHQKRRSAGGGLFGGKKPAAPAGGAAPAADAATAAAATAAAAPPAAPKARPALTRKDTILGTPEYCAPEVALWYWHELVPPRLPEPPPMYGPKADVWALGMCLHVMLCGCFPFPSGDGVEEDELLRTVNAATFTFNDPGWRKVSEEALDLVGQLLQRDPLDRPVLEEVLQHAFCADALQEAMLAEAGRSRRGGHDLDKLLAALDGDES